MKRRVSGGTQSLVTQTAFYLCTILSRLAAARAGWLWHPVHLQDGIVLQADRWLAQSEALRSPAIRNPPSAELRSAPADVSHLLLTAPGERALRANSASR